jgi:5-methylthioadenosine/S-adenosylhomocysteine deaminase
MTGKACDTLITADYILTQNRDRTVLENGALAVSDGLVEDLGRRDEMERRFDPERRLDLGRALVLPGLINAHTHAPMTLLRGLADDLPLMQWLTEHIWPIEAELSEEQIRAGAMLAAAEMISTGCTCFHDMYFFESSIGRAVSGIGMRAVLGEGVLAFPTPSCATPEQAMDATRSLVQEFDGNDLISVSVAPHAAYTTSEEILTKSFELAEELDLPWTIHLAETQHEVDESIEKFGKRPLAYLNDLGCLAPRSVLVHCVYLDDEEIEVLAESGACVAHQPESNMKLASGTARIQRLKEAGVPACLGTDGAASNNNLNMFTEMATTSLLQKSWRMDPTVMDSQSVLDMATRGGAHCLMRTDLGSLEPGRAADLAVLDLTRPNLAPVYNPVSHCVYAASGQEVRLTMIAGRIVYSEGEFKTFDYPALLDEIENIRQWVLRRSADK